MNEHRRTITGKNTSSLGRSIHCSIVEDLLSRPVHTIRIKGSVVPVTILEITSISFVKAELLFVLLSFIFFSFFCVFSEFFAAEYSSPK
jgi:hypothetical protein